MYEIKRWDWENVEEGITESSGPLYFAPAFSFTESIGVVFVCPLLMGESCHRKLRIGVL